ncbi:MAG TPA: M28 family peptidase [Algoriphagus sp.]|nr:M28 family peptidase [Algoriphagus sp.]
MKKSTITLSLVFMTGSLAFSQKQEIEKNFNSKDAISEFTYLASDELMGRDPARLEMKLAYTFIADQLKKAGAMPVPGADGYYQNIPFRLSTPPKSGSVKIGGAEFTQGKNMLVLDGKSFSGSYSVVDLGFGMPEDFAGKDVKGKIVITNAGAPNKLSPNQLFSEGRDKTARAKEAGAVALIERFNIPSVPWQMISGFLNRTQMSVDQGAASDLPYIWIEDVKNQMTGEKVKSAEVAVDGKVNTAVEGKNVIAWIEGTDPELKNEFIMLSAHYDHVGVGTPDAEGDSIFNGARDNAVGTVAVINAAKFFAKNPPKRSVLFALWTAEEKGLLGSGYFANNPLVPLNQIIYNLNIDNAGYNDTSIITVIGLGRTSADFMIEEAVADFGLTAKADPSPEQGLYDRSDNVNFARKGIPAPSFTLGFTAFDDKIQQYYHKAADEVDSFDLEYAKIYWKSFILSAQKIANWSERPTWVAGDKYEEVSKELYGGQK